MTRYTGAGVSGASKIEKRRLTATAALIALALAGCGGGQTTGPPTLVIAGIPDQDVSVLEERFDGVADSLEERLGIPVEYRPATDYAAVVTAFRTGDVSLGWFGGLTGVQARLAVPGARAVAQRPIDAEFRSVFVVARGVEAETLADLAGTTLTFGSESSTSGHLMPRFFLLQAGVDPDGDLDGDPGYSGSHDTTWKLVESGAFDAGALNAAVWDRAVANGDVDTTAVRELARTDPYYDYHWVVRPDLDGVYGQGTTEALIDALLGMGDGPEDQRVLELFGTDRFVPTENDNYAAIETVARSLGLISG